MPAMKRALRLHCAVLLALLLVVTGQAAAVARGMPAAQGQITICSGTGPVMIHVDARGVPTAPPHLCPDAALSLIQSAVDAGGFALLAGRPATVLTALPHAVSATGAQAVPAQARDPPRVA